MKRLENNNAATSPTIVIPALGGDQAETMFEAGDVEGLFSALRDTDISVPARTQGRTSKHTERYSVCRLLSTLAKSEYLSFPLALKHRDRPDFLLSCVGNTIGIEVTEAASQDYSAYCFLAEKDANVKFLQPNHFRFGSQVTLEEKRDLLKQETLTGHGWGGDECEQEWKRFVDQAIKNKNKKASNSCFEKFQENWLLIYDNTPVGFLMEDMLFPHAEVLYKELFSDGISLKFDKIFIESRWCKENESVARSQLIALSSDGIGHFEIVDLWRE